MTSQTTATKRKKKEEAKAEEFIADAVAVAKRRSIANAIADKGITAEAIVAERDGAGRSWAQVAVNLGLGSPSAARKAYTELTGRAHHESQMSGKRARRAVTAGRTVDSPGWDDESDQEAIEARLNGTWVEEHGEGKNYMPAHWTGSDIVVRRTVGDHVYDEPVEVRRVTEFSFGPNGDQPLTVHIINRYNNGHRAFRVADIMEVR